MVYYPVYLDLRDRLALIIGGGEVAERKVASLLRCGARVNIVAKTLTSSFEKWKEEGRIRYLGKAYQSSFLDGAFLVIAATDDPDLNQKVSKEGFDAAVRSLGEVNKGFQALAAEVTGYSKNAAFEYISRLGVRYWQRCPLFLNLFNHKAQCQKRYWPNSYPNSQPLCVSLLQSRS